ncbi:MAG: hypothetical protein SOR74_09400 [Candidatus Faecivicinus sp.]|nr:hypothetical protein [Candidatus Faecivicinus sp.]
MVAAILSRIATQNLPWFEAIFGSHLPARCAAVVAACALGRQGRRPIAAALGHDDFESGSDSKSGFVLEAGLFPIYRKWSRIATPFAQFQRIFGFVRHSKTHEGVNHSFMRFVTPVHHTQGASRHHGGAATGKLGTPYRFDSRQILSRFPTQNRRD